MTEYETANLALQQAALTASYWRTGITLAVLSGVVLYGFRLMRQDTDDRRAEMDATAKTAEQRHVETMTVFRQQGRTLLGPAEPCLGSARPRLGTARSCSGSPDRANCTEVK